MLSKCVEAILFNALVGRYNNRSHISPRHGQESLLWLTLSIFWFAFGGCEEVTPLLDSTHYVTVETPLVLKCRPVRILLSWMQAAASFASVASCCSASMAKRSTSPCSLLMATATT